MTVDKKQREKDKWLPVKDIIDEKKSDYVQYFQRAPDQQRPQKCNAVFDGWLKKKVATCTSTFGVKLEKTTSSWLSTINHGVNKNGRHVQFAAVSSIFGLAS